MIKLSFIRQQKQTFKKIDSIALIQFCMGGDNMATDWALKPGVNQTDYAFCLIS